MRIARIIPHAAKKREIMKAKRKRERNCTRGGLMQGGSARVGYALGVSRVIKYKVNSFVELGGK